MTIADCIEANLRKLQRQNRTVIVNREHRVGAAIDKRNKNVSKLSCEIDGVDFQSNKVQLLKNPFATKSFQECLGSEEFRDVPLIWRNGDSSCVLELIL